MEVTSNVAKYFQARDYFSLQKILPNGGLRIASQAVNAQEMNHIILHWSAACLQTHIKRVLEDSIDEQQAGNKHKGLINCLHTRIQTN